MPSQTTSLVKPVRSGLCSSSRSKRSTPQRSRLRLGRAADVVAVLLGAAQRRVGEALVALRALALAFVDVVADRADEPVALARQPGERAADDLVGGAGAVGVGGDDGVDAAARAQQRDQPLLVDRLAEVQEAPAGPGAERAVGKIGHRDEAYAGNVAFDAKVRADSGGGACPARPGPHARPARPRARPATPSSSRAASTCSPASAPARSSSPTATSTFAAPESRPRTSSSRAGTCASPGASRATSSPSAGAPTCCAAAIVEGDIRYGDKKPVLAPGARVGGEVSKIDVDLGGAAPFVGALVWWLAVSVSTLLLGLLALWVAPRAAEAVIAQMRNGGWGPAAGVGLALMIGLPLLAALAFFTLVGIPLAITLLLALIPLAVLGYVACAWVLGRALVDHPPHRRATAFLAGWAILRVLALIPFFGAIVFLVAAMFGLGALGRALWAARGTGGPQRGRRRPPPRRSDRPHRSRAASLRRRADNRCMPAPAPHRQDRAVRPLAAHAAARRAPHGARGWRAASGSAAARALAEEPDVSAAAAAPDAVRARLDRSARRRPRRRHRRQRPAAARPADDRPRGPRPRCSSAGATTRAS